MKVIEPYVEFAEPIDGDVILKHLERCGRVCYRSEGKIGDGTAEKFLANIIKRGHEAVLEHYSFTVRFVCDRGVSHEIVRHRLASYCVSGDSVIRSMGQKSWTIKQLYDWQSDEKRCGRIKLMNVRSVDVDSMTVVPNKIKKITYMGKRPVYELKTESGRKIKCTEDHKILCKDGWKPLEEIVVGDFVCANGKELLENEDWLRRYYLDENHTREETAQTIGCCESLVYRAFKKFGIVKSQSDFPNRKPGYGVKGMHSDLARRNISERMKGSANHSYKVDRSAVSESGGYDATHKKFCVESEICEFCGAKKFVEIHHINKNPWDTRKANVKFLCSKCHKLWHKPGAIGVFYDRVVDVQYCGVEDVYDMSMDGNLHNFVANGIVVHNCQESQRYCNYGKDQFGGDVTFIKPLFFDEGTPVYRIWERSCKSAETAYFDLLNEGCAPQEARAVLPNSVKTELVMTANVREWRHFLKLRTSKAAHPQMRQIANQLLELCKSNIPVLFDDIGGDAE